MRKILNLLQTLYLSKQDNLTVEDLYRHIGVLSPKIIDEILQILLSENFTQAHNLIFEKLETLNTDVQTLIQKLARRLESLDINNPKEQSNLLR